GDVIAAAPVNAGLYSVRIIPGVSGGMMVEQPGTGRVLAMAGGFDAGLDAFNRATQAERQPGSTIKPFVYATALDNGMTPATMVPDQPFCVDQGGNLGQKCFRNFGGEGASGLHTMRWGLEQSRNLMTVHIASDTGMDKVVKTFTRMGIGTYPPYFSYALGAGETTVAQMVNAYSALADNGLQHEQSLIDFIQDRNGKVIWRADTRTCTGCNMVDWDGKPMPRFDQRGKQVMDPRTAYQVVHMLEGVVIRGTAATLRDLGLPLFGKTGTTSGPTNVWFMGGSQNMVGGVYIGYDQPRSLGGWVQGGTFAAPIFKQFVMATRDHWDHTPFLAPAGIRMLRVNRVTGQQVFGGTPSDEIKADVIWEAFKPQTEPQRETRADQQVARRGELLDAIRRGFDALSGKRKEQAPADFVVEQGGVY
ncbi:MAG TPA: penicillin-binding transpeptidase domain-containing protein, partial [Novosphingobium sp.]|nr:penicillin-binding transpeptidase domain-containing protein [Novosphingobium sp.]